MLQRLAVETPRQLGFRVETARYTKTEWAAAQSAAAACAAALCESPISRVAAASALKVGALVRMLEAPNRAVAAAAARLLRAVQADSRARSALDVGAGFRDLVARAHALVASAGEVARLTLSKRADDVEQIEEEPFDKSTPSTNRPCRLSDDLLKYRKRPGEANDVPEDDQDDCGVAWARVLNVNGQELLYYHAAAMDDGPLRDAAGALSLVAEELEELVETGDGRALADAWIVAFAEDRAWGFLCPLAHAPEPLAEAALRILAACCRARPRMGSVLVDCGVHRPLLCLDAPARSQPLPTRIPQLYASSPKARAAAGEILAACSKWGAGGFDEAVCDDERRALATLESLLEAGDRVAGPEADAAVAGAANAAAAAVAIRPVRCMLVELRFVENVAVPAWRAAAPGSARRVGLSTFLRQLLDHKPYLTKLLANFERRGRMPLFNSLTHELRCEDLGDEPARFDVEANTVANAWDAERKREQLDADLDAPDDPKRVSAVARRLAAALPEGGAFLELGANAGLVAAPGGRLFAFKLPRDPSSEYPRLAPAAAPRRPDERSSPEGSVLAQVAARLAELTTARIVIAEPCDAARLAVRDRLSGRASEESAETGRASEETETAETPPDVFEGDRWAVARADVRDKTLSAFPQVRGPFDVILFHDARNYVNDWETFLSDVVQKHLAPSSGKVCFLEDRDVGFVLGDDAVHAGLAEDARSGDVVSFPNTNDLLVFGFADGPPFPASEAAPAPKRRAAADMLAGGEEAGLLDLD